jgi:hypothetical protein
MNTSQQQPQQFVSLSGTHRARAKEWALGISSTGKEQIAVMFEIVAGPHTNKRITWYGYFTDEAVDRTLESLRHCGWKSDSLADLDSLADNEVELVVADETYEGKTNSKVRWVNRVARLALKEQMDAGQVAAFAAKLRGKCVASKQKYGAQPVRSSSHAPDPGYAAGDPGYSDDDVGF